MTVEPGPVEENPPAPDPSNSPPEDWTEDIDPAEADAVYERLQLEIGGS